MTAISLHLSSHGVFHKPVSNSIKKTTVKASSPSSSSAAEVKQVEIRVCTNRTCRRQGSQDTLQTLSGIAPPHVSVTSCGCLGRCGAGPNLVVLPEGVFVKHCSTAARAAETMAFLCFGREKNAKFDLESECQKCLEALALRYRAEVELSKGNFSESYSLLSQAIDQKPFGGIHIMFKDRCVVNLSMGNIAEALEDAKEALNLAPKYAEAYICQGDAFFASNQMDEAEKSYALALELDPSIRRSKSFKVRIAKLQEKLAPLNVG